MGLDSDKELLRELARSCKDAKERERLRALFALSAGYSVSDVATIFCVDEATLYRWIERWQEERNLHDREKSGRPPLFGEKEEKELKKLIGENDPKKHGINAGIWDCKELSRYFTKKGKPFSDEVIRAHLKKMGAHYIKAKIQYAEADLRLQRRFAKQFMKELGEKPENVIILFEDEAAVRSSAAKAYGWTFKKELIVKSHQKSWEKLNQFGAVDPINGKIIQLSSKEAKSPAFIRFLRKIEKSHPNIDIWIYLDNSKVHKSGIVQRFEKNHPRIHLKFLPPYSPELNPQEHWWRHERRKFLGNRSFGSTHQLATSLYWFGANTEPEEVASVCSLTHIEHLAGFK